MIAGGTGIAPLYHVKKIEISNYFVKFESNKSWLISKIIMVMGTIDEIKSNKQG